jgi:hypothetical protein
MHVFTGQSPFRAFEIHHFPATSASLTSPQSVADFCTTSPIKDSHALINIKIASMHRLCWSASFLSASVKQEYLSFGSFTIFAPFQVTAKVQIVRHARKRQGGVVLQDFQGASPHKHNQIVLAR